MTSLGASMLDAIDPGGILRRGCRASLFRLPPSRFGPLEPQIRIVQRYALPDSSIHNRLRHFLELLEVRHFLGQLHEFAGQPFRKRFLLLGYRLFPLLRRSPTPVRCISDPLLPYGKRAPVWPALRPGGTPLKCGCILLFHCSPPGRQSGRIHPYHSWPPVAGASHMLSPKLSHINPFST